MSLDEFVNSSKEAKQDTGNNRDFERYTKEEFEQCLSETNYDFKEVDYSWTKERVYEATSKNGDFSIRVFSSVDKRSNKARDKGSDAIRTVVIHNPTGKPVLREKRTNRIKTWRKNLKKKINNIGSRKDELKTCSKCGRVMVIRTNKKDNSKFWGCTGYDKDPNKRECSNTESMS